MQVLSLLITLLPLLATAGTPSALEKALEDCKTSTNDTDIPFCEMTKAMQKHIYSGIMDADIPKGVSLQLQFGLQAKAKMPKWDQKDAEQLQTAFKSLGMDSEIPPAREVQSGGKIELEQIGDFIQSIEADFELRERKGDPFSKGARLEYRKIEESSE